MEAAQTKLDSNLINFEAFSWEDLWAAEELRIIWLELERERALDSLWMRAMILTLITLTKAPACMALPPSLKEAFPPAQHKTLLV